MLFETCHLCDLCVFRQKLILLLIQMLRRAQNESGDSVIARKRKKIQIATCFHMHTHTHNIKFRTGEFEKQLSHVSQHSLGISACVEDFHDHLQNLVRVLQRF